MRNRVNVLAVAVMAAVTLGASSAAARTDAMKVVGGGLATFDDVARLSSYFGVKATIQDDGTTAGEFTCVITDFMIVLGNLNSSRVNDDGSVKLEGVSDIFLVQTGDVMEDVPYSVVVWEGGPKAGRFLLHIAGFPEPGDYGTLFLGAIQIRR